METQSVIFVAGTETLIGAALVRELKRLAYEKVLGEPPLCPDLTDANSVQAFFQEQRPNYVFMAAGKSGGIEANRRYPASLMLDNLLIETHVIRAAHEYSVKKLLYLASSCCYPKFCEQPMRVDSLMTGALESTNEAYATAKLAGIKLCQAYRQEYGDHFIVGIPANAFGPNDDFEPENAHVIAALLVRMHDAKLRGLPSINIWGTGNPRREFVYVDDLAKACLFVMHHYDDSQPINLGGGTDVAIKDLAALIKEIVGYKGNLEFDPTRPDGMPFKALDSSPLLSLGWQPTISFQSALEATYQAYLQT